MLEKVNASVRGGITEVTKPILRQGGRIKRSRTHRKAQVLRKAGKIMFTLRRQEVR